MQVSVATPEKIIFSGAAEDVLLNAEKGQINLLERHAHLITLVKPGIVTVKTSDSDNLLFQVGEGVLKVDGDKVSILCGEASKA